ncbi:MAG: rhamnulokinase [Prevotella sp.]|nr:rhamnulokinase [Prevotella sp.]
MFLAVDLGATSGRTIVGSIADGIVRQEELTRFDNHLIEQGGHFYWDIYALYREIISAMKKAATLHLDIESIGIDTWGVDFVCIGEDGAPLRLPRAYRDPSNFAAMDHYLANVTNRKELYEATGTQIIYFNSLFQLHGMRQQGDSALQHARRILFMPDAISYMLTGEAVCEYTIASTSQLIDPHTRDFNAQLLKSIGLSREMFGRLVMPGTVVGTLTEEVQRLTGLGAIPVVAVAGHDTASAVAAVPASDAHFAYLSSGTWSLMGIEMPQPVVNEWSSKRNFTNEGGIEHTIRLLKNICGMWLYERCRKEGFRRKEERGERKEDGNESLGHSELMQLAAEAEPFRCLINPDDEVFANPESMTEAIQDYCQQTEQPIPETPGQLCRCIFESLALRYRQVLGDLREVAPDDIRVLHIIGGGSRNQMLNQFAANACAIDVLAGPQECTAAGNILMQAKAAGQVADRWQMRQMVARSNELRRYTPQQLIVWDAAYDQFLNIIARH